VYEEDLAGQADSTLIARCADEQRALITLDLDFADIRTYPPELLPGVVVLRPAEQDVISIRAAVSHVIALLEDRQLPGRLWIVEQGQVRIRGERDLSN
jgi:hypothetical protein